MKASKATSTRDPVSMALGVLQEKWSPHVIRALLEGPKGFNELARITGVSPVTLSQRLEQLETLGLVRKTVLSEQPPRVSIELLPPGVAFERVLEALYTWGGQHLDPRLESGLLEAEEAIDVLQGRWAMGVVRILLNGPCRVNELARALGGANPTTLTQRLERLERLGMVHREVVTLMPPRTIVSLTEAGAAIRPVFDALEAWATTHLVTNKNA
jgi:DNA-binding HxlR family transcriptional regulator